MIALLAAPASARQSSPVHPGEVLDGPVAVYPEHLAGRRMASGATYRPTDLVAAHPTLPFGTELVVEAAGRTVRVVVMDRGPYDSGVRLLVSGSAGARLGLGEEPRWMRIRRQDESAGSGAGSAAVPGPPATAWTVQLGSFSDAETAERLAARFSGARVERGPGGTWRVRFGRFVDRDEAEAWRERLEGWGVSGFVRPSDAEEN